MREELLKLVKKDFEREKKRQKELKIKLKRKANLEQNKWVKEYLELKEELDESFDKELVDKTDSQILRSSYASNVKQEDSTNNIYMYMGTYRRSNEIDVVHGANDYRIEYDSPKADYRLYKNLEYEYDYEMIPISQCCEFEKTHNFIHAKGYMREAKFYKIQEEFIELAVKYGQEEACKRILKKYK